MSNTPLVKTIGSGRRTRRAARSASGQSLSRKSGIGRLSKAAPLSRARQAARSGARRLALVNEETTMITLCGIAISNYYNKVKMALLEKGIPFTEERVKTHSTDPAVLAC